MAPITTFQVRTKSTSILPWKDLILKLNKMIQSLEKQATLLDQEIQIINKDSFTIWISDNGFLTQS